MNNPNDLFKHLQLSEMSDFENIECKREDHITPAGAIQNFVFCSFVKERD